MNKSCLGIHQFLENILGKCIDSEVSPNAGSKTVYKVCQSLNRKEENSFIQSLEVWLYKTINTVKTLKHRELIFSYLFKERIPVLNALYKDIARTYYLPSINNDHNKIKGGKDKSVLQCIALEWGQGFMGECFSYLCTLELLQVPLPQGVKRNKQQQLLEETANLNTVAPIEALYKLWEKSPSLFTPPPGQPLGDASVPTLKQGIFLNHITRVFHQYLSHHSQCYDRTTALALLIYFGQLFASSFCSCPCSNKTINTKPYLLRVPCQFLSKNLHLILNIQTQKRRHVEEEAHVTLKCRSSQESLDTLLGHLAQHYHSALLQFMTIRQAGQSSTSTTPSTHSFKGMVFITQLLSALLISLGANPFGPSPLQVSNGEKSKLIAPLTLAHDITAQGVPGEGKLLYRTFLQQFCNASTVSYLQVLGIQPPSTNREVPKQDEEDSRSRFETDSENENEEEMDHDDPQSQKKRQKQKKSHLFHSSDLGKAIDQKQASVVKGLQALQQESIQYRDELVHTTTLLHALMQSRYNEVRSTSKPYENTLKKKNRKGQKYEGRYEAEARDESLPSASRNNNAPFNRQPIIRKIPLIQTKNKKRKDSSAENESDADDDDMRSINTHRKYQTSTSIRLAHHKSGRGVFKYSSKSHPTKAAKEEEMNDSSSRTSTANRSRNRRLRNHSKVEEERVIYSSKNGIARSHFDKEEEEINKEQVYSSSRSSKDRHIKEKEEETLHSSEADTSNRSTRSHSDKEEGELNKEEVHSSSRSSKGRHPKEEDKEEALHSSEDDTSNISERSQSDKEEGELNKEEVYSSSRISKGRHLKEEEEEKALHSSEDDTSNRSERSHSDKEEEELNKEQVCSSSRSSKGRHPKEEEEEEALHSSEDDTSNRSERSHSDKEEEELNKVEVHSSSRSSKGRHPKEEEEEEALHSGKDDTSNRRSRSHSDKEEEELNKEDVHSSSRRSKGRHPKEEEEEEALHSSEDDTSNRSERSHSDKEEEELNKVEVHSSSRSSKGRHPKEEEEEEALHSGKDDTSNRSTRSHSDKEEEELNKEDVHSSSRRSKGRHPKEEALHSSEDDTSNRSTRSHCAKEEEEVKKEEVYSSSRRSKGRHRKEEEEEEVLHSRSRSNRSSKERTTQKTRSSEILEEDL